MSQFVARQKRETRRDANDARVIRRVLDGTAQDDLHTDRARAGGHKKDAAGQ